MPIQEFSSTSLKAKPSTRKRFESLKVLKSEILDASEKLDELNQKLLALDPDKIESSTSEEELILIGYFLSGIYSTFEDIFVKVAREFENKVEDPTQWPRELLNRMALEIEEVRPALISKQSKDCLDELRRFRHVFRFSYAFELDWERMLIVAKRWTKNSKPIRQDMERFIDNLDELAA